MEVVPGASMRVAALIRYTVRTRGVPGVPGPCRDSPSTDCGTEAEDLSIGRATGKAAARLNLSNCMSQRPVIPAFLRHGRPGPAPREAVTTGIILRRFFTTRSLMPLLPDKILTLLAMLIGVAGISGVLAPAALARGRRYAGSPGCNRRAGRVRAQESCKWLFLVGRTLSRDRKVFLPGRTVCKVSATMISPSTNPVAPSGTSVLQHFDYGR